MENAILIIHLVLVVFLVGIVLLQRSEGGALGMGGGGGGGGVMTGRGAATALQRATWYIAVGFLATSLTLTIMATTDRGTGSVFDEPVPGVNVPLGDEALQPTFVPPSLEGDSIIPAIEGADAPAAADPDNIIPAPEPQ